ncbi:GntR family transcriptional regulator [Pusillimonas sp. ANT_WB101]|uniref:GntR family transcriptional regulator n=1 Tax=Pusillimonas sp. ANT_WB101 TaxID=2597356 RepID=UPI00165E28E1|nr:GntR family transcriptional regulator [Pusillimonas sp. ANT_WB101]
MSSMAHPVMINPEPVKAGGLSSTVYDRLKSAILSQEITPSTAMQETDLGAKFQVSRTPVREALHDLLREGLVRRRGRFYYVAQLSPLEIRHLYEVREALERMSVRLFIEYAPEASLDTLNACLNEQVDALKVKEIDRLNTLDSEFHLTIAHLTGNTLLQQQLASVHDKVILARGQTPSTTPTWSDRVIVEHGRILNALSRRDVAVSDAEMRYHINSAARLHLGMKQTPLESSV